MFYTRSLFSQSPISCINPLVTLPIIIIIILVIIIIQWICILIPKYVSWLPLQIESFQKS